MSVSGLKTPHAIASILGIVPTITTSSLNSSTPEPRLYINSIRGTIYVILLLFNMAGLLYGKIALYGHEIHKSVLVTFSTMEMVVSILNIASICILNLRHGPKFQTFLKRLKQLELFIIDNENIAELNRNGLIEFYVSTLLTICFGCLSAYVYCTNMGWGAYKFFMVREFQNIHANVLMDCVIQYPRLIRLRLKELNEHLRSIVLQSDRVSLASSAGMAVKSKQKVTFKMITEAYTSIHALINEFNDLIGPICMIFYASMVMNILVPINMALLLMHDIPLNANYYFDVPFIVFCILWVLFPSVTSLRLCHACDNAEKEAGKVPYLCYALMNSLSENEFKIKQELEEYANQADRLKTSFSANGFFGINHGIVMPVFGSIFTYVIVLLQFQNIN